MEEEEESPGELNALPRMAELRQGGTECNPQHHPAERERPRHRCQHLHMVNLQQHHTAESLPTIMPHLHPKILEISCRGTVFGKCD